MIRVHIERPTQEKPSPVEGKVFRVTDIAGYAEPQEERGVPRDPSAWNPTAPTTKQIQFLHALGYRGETPSSKYLASALIDELKRAQEMKKREEERLNLRMEF
jgi:hypothetical protein